jgi:tRNA G46 methylase TrmB
MLRPHHTRVERAWFQRWKLTQGLLVNFAFDVNLRHYNVVPESAGESVNESAGDNEPSLVDIGSGAGRLILAAGHDKP